jgi:predicted S18 family serine protease
MKKILAAALLLMVFASPVFATTGHYHHRHNHHQHHQYHHLA